MKVSVTELRKVLQKQLDDLKSGEERELAKEVAKRKSELKEAIGRGERYIKRAKELLDADGADCLAELGAPPHFYPNRYRSREASEGVRRALKLLDLSATDELSLADATRLVGKQIIEAL